MADVQARVYEVEVRLLRTVPEIDVGAISAPTEAAVAVGVVNPTGLYELSVLGPADVGVAVEVDL